MTALADRRVPHWGLLIAGLTLVAAAPRIAATWQALFGDELFTYAVARRDSLDDVLSGVQDLENVPPLYDVLAWLSGKVGDDARLIRLPALVSGIAAVPVVGLLGRRVSGDVGGLVAAAMIAASPFAVYYSSEARAYAPVTLAVAAATLCLLEALETRRRGWWVGLVISTAAALWLHYIAIFPLMAHAAWALIAHPTRRREVVLAHCAAVALFLPWLPSGGQKGRLLGRFEISQLVDFPLRALIGWPNGDATEVPGRLVLAAFVVIAAVTAIAAIRGVSRRRPSAQGVLLAMILLATPAGLLLYSAIGDGIFFARNLIVAVPAAAVLLAGCIVRRPVAVAIPVAALAIGLLVPTSARIVSSDLRRPAYDDAAAVLDREAGPNDVIVEEPAGRLVEPLYESLGVFLDRPHVRLRGPEGATAAWDEGLRGARVFWLYTEESAPPATMVDPRFAEVSRRTWPRRNAGLVLVEFGLR